MKYKCYSEIKEDFKFEFLSFNYYTKSEFGEILIYNKLGDHIDTITCDCSLSDFYNIYRIFRDAGCEASENRNYSFTKI